jgi:transaldolase
VTLSIDNLKIKIFADGANLETMVTMAGLAYIKGLTTNPTHMRKAGITNFKKFSLSVLNEIKEKPISFEIFSDDLDGMVRQGLEIASWASNVYVKIPITTTEGEPTLEVVKKLVDQGVKVNVTALMTSNQVKSVVEVLDSRVPSYISVFAGRIADTGRDPLGVMSESLKVMKSNKTSELIWASPRELLNVFQADSIGCHIITATSDILNKLKLVGKDLEEYSLETVQMFRDDAISSGYEL